MTWYRKPKRHSLASRGIKTSPYQRTEITTPTQYNDVLTKNNNGISINTYDGRNRIANANIMLHTNERDQRWLDINEPHLYLGIIIVDKNYQNQGIGNQIMNNIIEQQERYGLPLYLVAHPPDDSDPERLVNYYRKFGFNVDKLDNTGNIVMVRR